MQRRTRDKRQAVMKINVCHVNITSIVKHKYELLAKYSTYDIISVNETNLKRDQKFVLKGYNIYRNDRVGRRGGGVLLAVKQHIKCYEIFNDTIGENEIIAIEIPTTALKSIIIASMYVPPKVQINGNVFQTIYNLNNNCMIIGDLNAAIEEMGSRKTTLRGRQLQRVLEEGYIYAIEDVYTTYERNDHEEKLDWILASQPLLSLISNVDTHPVIGTTCGHKPLTFNISIGVEPKPTSPRTTYNFKEANWIKFRKSLNDQLKVWNNSSPINCSANIEEYSTFITKCLTTATNEAIPTSPQVISSYTNSAATKQLIELKHKTYRRWKKNGDETEKHQYYRYKILLTNSLLNDRKNHYKKVMESLCQKKMYSESVWLTIRKFHNKRIKQSFPRIMKYNNIEATSDKQKADLFAEYFEKEVYAAPVDSTLWHDYVTNEANNTKNRLKSTPTKKWRVITPDEVKGHIKQLRNSSPGPDNIHNRCLKNYTTLLIQHLTQLFNAVGNVGYIPDMWKKANIILLLKPNKDKQHPSSYRPISLLSCLGKLLERIMKQRMMNVLNRRNILPQHQAGFRSKKSTMYNIVRLESYAHSQKKQSKHVAAIFFDIKAAFDAVWHDGLIFKCNELRLPQYLIKYLVSFLDKRTAAIELDNTLSRLFTLNSGTPQGSPISPLLYILYTADSMNGIPSNTEHGLFADDTALWTASHVIRSLNSKLQKAINEFQKWCQSWHLKLQPAKTELIHFSLHPNKKYKNPVQVTVGNTTIKPVTSTRYLGVLFDYKLNWKTHIQHIETKIAARICLLRFLNKVAINANDKIMTNLYKSLVRSVIVYGYPVLLTASKTMWNRLQIIQNKALRAAFGLPHYTSTEYIHRIANIPKIYDYAKTLLERAVTTAASNNENEYRTLLHDILQQLPTIPNN